MEFTINKYSVLLRGVVPISPIIADIVVTAVIKYSLERVQCSVRILHQFDDAVICPLSSNIIDEMLGIKNYCHSKVNFTVKK